MIKFSVDLVLGVPLFVTFNVDLLLNGCDVNPCKLKAEKKKKKNEILLHTMI